MEVLHENVILTRLKAMWEGIGNVRERFGKLDYVEIKQRDDDIRISGLEKIIRFDREHAKAVARDLTGE
jgi:phosphoribosylaminoimidazole carboxylase (NCAIR synthetase)